MNAPPCRWLGAGHGRGPEVGGPTVHSGDDGRRFEAATLGWIEFAGRVDGGARCRPLRSLPEIRFEMPLASR